MTDPRNADTSCERLGDLAASDIAQMLTYSRYQGNGAGEILILADGQKRNIRG